MPRISLRIAALLAVTLLISVMFAISGPHARAATTGYQIDIKVSDDIYTVACDGVDSFRITATVTLDGAPVQGADVYVQSSLVGQTNRRGVLKFDYAPPPKPGFPKTYAYVYATTGGTTVSPPMPRFFSCPFPSGPYSLTATFFVDGDADGRRDHGERAFGNRRAHLFLSAHTLQATVDPRAYHTDAGGSFTATLYTAGYDEPGGHWVICLAPGDTKNAIGSVNGVVVASPYRCGELPQLAAGANVFSIGVVKR